MGGGVKVFLKSYFTSFYPTMIFYFVINSINIFESVLPVVVFGE